MNDTSFETPYLKTLHISNNIYDRFVPDQVLTHHNLNKIIDYFEDQDRLSRVHTIGVGIGCGLDFFVETDEDNNTVIKVNAGVGITTDGDLVVIDTSKSKQQTYEFRYYTNPFFNRAEYARFSGLNISEIHSQERAELLTGEQPLSSFSNLSSHYLLVYVENYNENPGVCSGSGCDDTGEHIYANLKFLLTDKEGFDALTTEEMDSIYFYKKMRSFYDSLPELSITRPLLKTSNTKAQDSIYTLYKNGIESNTVVTQLQDSFIKIIDKLDNRLNVKRFNITLENIKTRFESLTTIESFPVLDIQYRYDLLKDLIETYNEIRNLLLHINADCVPNTTAFPKHLLLGAINPDKREFTRHDFYPSNIVDNDGENLQNVLSLIIRFYNQLDQYHIPASDQLIVNKKINSNAFKNISIQITPSRNYTHTLTHRSIPYYYRTLNNLVKNWNFKDILNRRATAQLGYHKSKLLNIDSIRNPLAYNHQEYDFYRIEGHLGKKYTTVLSKITQLKTDFNLAFDVKAISIGEALEEINLEDYSCEFEDLKTLLKAWKDEFNCLVKNGYEFFKNYDFNTVGKNATKTDYLDSVRKTKKILRRSKAKATDTGSKNERLIGEAMEYAINQTNTTDSDVLYRVASEYMVREVGGFENQEKAQIYVEYPTKIVADLYAVEREFIDDLQIYTRPGGLDAFTTFLNKLCFNLNKAKEDIVSARNNKTFGNNDRDSMYEFMIYDLSKLCCFKSKINWLLEEMETRKKKIFDQLTLSNLVKENSGLEHLAGTPKGGTFFIVYGGLDRTSKAYSNKVIADFTVPYMCVSNCPPNIIVMQQEVEATEGLVLEPNVFCIVDGTEIAKGTFTVTPEDGIISSAQGSKFIEENTLFNPNSSSISESLLGVPITFTVNEKSVEETATVYKIPNKAHFENPTNLEIVSTINASKTSADVTISPKTPYDNKGYLTYSWVNDAGEEVSTAAILNINIPIVEGKIVQKLQLTMGVNNPKAICTTTIDVKIEEEVTIEEEEVDLVLQPNVFCFEDGTTTAIEKFKSIVPAGKPVTSNQGKKIVVGESFNPNAVPNSLLGSILGFKVDNKDVSQTATVYKIPAKNHFKDKSKITVKVNRINPANASANVSITPITPFDANGYLTYLWKDQQENTVGSSKTLTVNIPITNGNISQKFTLTIGINNDVASCSLPYDIQINEKVETSDERNTCFTDFQTRLKEHSINTNINKSKKETKNTDFADNLNNEVIAPTALVLRRVNNLTKSTFAVSSRIKALLNKTSSLLSILSEKYIQNPNSVEFLPQFLLLHEALTLLFLELTRCSDSPDIENFGTEIDMFQGILKQDQAIFKDRNLAYAHITQEFYNDYDAKVEDLKDLLKNIFDFVDA